MSSYKDFWPIVVIEGAKMGQKSGLVRVPAEQVVKEIRRATRRQFSAEEKIGIVLSGLRGEDSIAELCRREGIVQNLYYRWSKEFLEAGRRRLAGDTARAATSDEVKDLRREAGALKEVVAELMLENRLLKKHARGWGGRRVRYPAAEKLEIVRLVEQSPLPARRTLAQLGIPPATFYRWYDRHSRRGPEALSDRSPRPHRVWNRIPDGVRDNIIELALDKPALSPRELAVRFTDTKSYFLSEASVYRLLKARDLIASPAFIVIKASNAFKDKTTAPNQLWQTDFTYLKVIGWGGLYLSTVLDDFSRYIVAWKLCTTMMAEDVTATLDSFAEFFERTGRIEIIRFPYGEQPPLPGLPLVHPWLHVWTMAPEKPARSIPVKTPYNYPFADHVSDALTANGYAVHLRRGDLQQAVADLTGKVLVALGVLCGAEPGTISDQLAG